MFAASFETPVFCCSITPNLPIFLHKANVTKREEVGGVLIDSMEQSTYGGTDDVCVSCPGYYEPFMEFQGLLPSSRYPPVGLSQRYCIGAPPS